MIASVPRAWLEAVLVMFAGIQINGIGCVTNAMVTRRNAEGCECECVPLLQTREERTTEWW